MNGDYDLVVALANAPGRCLGDDALIAAAERLRGGRSDTWTEDYINERLCPDLRDADE